MEVSDHGVADLKIIRRKNEFIGPPFAWLKAVVRRDSRFKSTHGRCSNSANSPFTVECLVYHIYSVFAHDEIFGIHLVFCEIFNVYRTEGSQANVQGDE